MGRGMNPRRIAFRVHAIQRMFERSINEDDVRAVLTSGEMIEDYPADTPYPIRLLLGWRGIRPLHVAAAYNVPDNETIVITVYEPDPRQWESDFRRRRP